MIAIRAGKNAQIVPSIEFLLLFVIILSITRTSLYCQRFYKSKKKRKGLLFSKYGNVVDFIGRKSRKMVKTSKNNCISFIGLL